VDVVLAGNSSSPSSAGVPLPLSAFGDLCLLDGLFGPPVSDSPSENSNGEIEVSPEQKKMTGGGGIQQDAPIKWTVKEELITHQLLHTLVGMSGPLLTDYFGAPWWYGGVGIATFAVAKENLIDVPLVHQQRIYSLIDIMFYLTGIGIGAVLVEMKHLSGIRAFSITGKHLAKVHKS
jgi:hypothetical protein